MPRGLILAFGFLTRLPMPQLAGFKEEELSSSALWFPLVGLSIGLLLLLAVWLGLSSSPWLAALLVVLLWTGITGALHLDGAADLADALGAAHREPERLLDVMKDPHTGTFGVVAIVAILLTKLVAVAWIVESPQIELWALLLIPAWARLGAIFWSQTLDAIAPGSGERFKWDVPEHALWGWGLLLFLMTWAAASLLFGVVALSALLLWREYLKCRLGGMTGDCLGAGIEYCECLMLLALGLL
ncbi:cobalamin-5'-phosphate synthase [Mariprofundus aestuarium]|uniref:Adenosylcobinamide-GDP ribazoletransferase n=1 Tax=Mariprofundus aestuarium TaxID=1921086 RepID=A0A2K8L1B9_MARES|nr:adenosylcobinamide-GDP ribazoletransferase [Mariprofundus aestuarium]ATX78724.1 cobalamin-5'-phosphate synthase [Mariprofundus aestuarium]